MSKTTPQSRASRRRWQSKPLRRPLKSASHRQRPSKAGSRECSNAPVQRTAAQGSSTSSRTRPCWSTGISKITYVNEATKALLTKHREHFQKLAWNFDPENMIGACIDMFHKDPSHQRRLLADPSNLPHRTDIELGPLTFALCVSATYDQFGTQ